MKIQLLLSFFILFFSFQVFSTSQSRNKENAERFIIQGLNDSAKVFIPKMEDKSYAAVLKRIVSNNGTYVDFLKLVKNVNFYSKIQYQQLNRFINKRVKYPENLENVNLDFVILKSYHIELIANELELKDANKESFRLREYLSKIKNKESKFYQLANLYTQLHPCLLDMIKSDPKGQQKTFGLAEKALKLGDLLLALRFRDLAINYYISSNDLDGYILACKKTLEMESEFPERSEMYEVTVAHLLDALIFKQQGSDEYIENLLLKLYYSPDYQLKSFSLYAKYIGHLEKNDPGLQRIFKVFEVNNLQEFFGSIIKRAKGKLNDNELYYLYHESSVAAYYQEDYATSFSFGNDKTYLGKKIYSTELSQTIADYQTREIELEKEFKIKEEKAKAKYYVIILLIVGFFLIVSIYLAVIYLRKSNILAIRNKEKDTLLREIHHRVKNNFELVNTLLELQGGDVDSQLAKDKLSEGQNRISSMSLIHQKLYQTEYLEDLDFQEYTQQLVELILKSANKLQNTNIKIVANSLKLDIDTAIPLGLILNELCTNSCKYAFSETEINFLNIHIEKQDNQFYKLTYQDSGKAEIQSETSKPKGIGLLLIKSLTKQLQGKYTYTFENGAQFVILFKNKNQRKEIE